MSVTIDLSGRAALVTGGAGGLGLACAAVLAAAGADVALCDLEEGRLTAAATNLATAATDPAAGAYVPGRIVTRAADLSDRAQATATVEWARTELGRLDILVNSAGIMQTKPLLDLGEDEWRRMIDINLNGTFWVTQAAGRLMAEQGSGSIVTLASVAARSGRPNAAHYSASKTALLSLTKSAAAALAPSVRVNAVCPGVFLTGMWQDIITERNRRFGKQAGDDYLRQTRESSLLGREGDPTELASVVLFLASDLASFVTGQAINVDGGLEMD